NGGKNSLNRLIRCVCGKKIGPDPRNFNQRVSLGRNDLLIRTFHKRILKDTEVTSICKIMSRRLRTRRIQNEMFQFDSLLRYMYAWREIDSPKIVCRCLRRICKEDDGFLNLLLRLRGVVFSSHRGAYRELRIYEISRLTGFPEVTIASRLESLGKQHSRVWMVDELQNSLENTF
ncbi:hypothetical protein ABKV53_17140, partial [Enterobacter cloacae]|uniref:hypothetical protein n=1 Tax=Enterobacter cloacae TaxID=550 RepID=UPI0032AF93D7